ncbi:MAG TPA: NAD(P)-binding protein [Streptosporangiaceae bacterium]|nr:NAD(P)-binding protein [Streptosporangiaceae bacterium]
MRVVIGAGPSGLCSTIALARRGHQVAVSMAMGLGVPPAPA